MKFSISRDAKILAFAFCVFGIGCIVMEIWIYQDTSELSVVCSVFGSALIGYGIVLIISSIINYIYIDDKKIALYHRNKFKKSIEITDVKRLIIWQINFHGEKNAFIIFDDGTFFNKKFKKKDLFTKKTIEQESWIIIDYSDRRFDQIKYLISKCPVVTITPDQYE